MEALRVTEDAAALPVLRPLIGMDKEEIVRFARRIGTFDTSILPYEDCCTVFTPRHPKTKPRLDEARAVEAALDVDALCARAMAGREFVKMGLSQNTRNAQIACHCEEGEARRGNPSP